MGLHGAKSNADGPHNPAAYLRFESSRYSSRWIKCSTGGAVRTFERLLFQERAARVAAGRADLTPDEVRILWNGASYDEAEAAGNRYARSTKLRRGTCIICRCPAGAKK